VGSVGAFEWGNRRAAILISFFPDMVVLSPSGEGGDEEIVSGVVYKSSHNAGRILLEMAHVSPTKGPP